MGEIADAMLDGTLCECCGEYIGEGGAGYPRYCSDQCARDRGAAGSLPNSDTLFTLAKMQKYACDICGARLKTAEGVEQHKRAKHDTEER
jgi:hypothetical protein